jgi:hypothetical protein
MTLEERVARLEQRIDQLDRIEQRLESVEVAVVGLRSDFNAYRVENGAILGRILATLENLQQHPVVFRWPWEHA